jgi:riboflavin kinase/FMN adenylyltransferase
MEVYRDFACVQHDNAAVVTVGTFDGIHLGHRYLIDEVVKRAQRTGFSSTLVTFDPHPRMVLGTANRKQELRLLTPTEEKLSLLRELNIERVILINFTLEFAQKDSADFVKEVLYDTIGFSEIVIGHDHAFGHNRSGNISTLRELSEQLGFRVDKLEPFEKDGEVVSSSRIRSFLESGQIEKATKILGRNYAIRGHVVEGDRRGRELGFPTANLEIAETNKLIPQNAVYAVKALVGKRWYGGMMNIGARPTFDNAGSTIEVHLLDFDGDLYGQDLEIRFERKLREQKRFADLRDLVEQLNIDRERTKEILNQRTKEVQCL